MTALIDFARLYPSARGVPVSGFSVRSRSTVLDSATLLARFGLAPHLVAHWMADSAGHLVCLARGHRAAPAVGRTQPARIQ